MGVPPHPRFFSRYKQSILGTPILGSLLISNAEVGCRCGYLRRYDSITGPHSLYSLETLNTI